MEKRKYPRQKVDVEAVINFKTSESYLCRIKDYSASGLLVVLSSYRMAHKQQALDFNVIKQGQLTLKLDGRYYTTDVDVVHGSETSIGVRFRKSSDQFVAAISKVASVVSVSTPTAAGSNEFEKSQLSHRSQSDFLKSADSCFQQYLDERFGLFFEKTQQQLLEAADKQKTDADQHPFFAAISGFEKQAKRINSKFREMIFAEALALKQSKSSVADKKADKNESYENISLVQKDEFEDWLIVRVTASRSELDFREILTELQMRLDVAFGGDENSHVNNPYSPLSLCHCFAETIGFLTLSSKIEKLIFSSFQKFILDSLQTLYGDLNELLKNAGVLTNVNISKHLMTKALQKGKEIEPEGSVAGDNKPQLSSTPVKSPLKDFQRDIKKANNAYSAIKSLWALNKPAAVETSNAGVQPLTVANPPGAAVQMPVSLTHALEKIKQNIATNNDYFKEQNPLARIIADGEVGQQLHVSEGQLASVNFVDGLMEKIVENNAVDSSVIPHLKKLEIPMLDALVRDENFFDEADHPFQLLVNKLIHLAKKDSINAVANKKILLESISELLKRDLKDIDFLNQKIDQIETHIARETASVERNTERVLQSYEGKEKLLTANARIEETLNSKLGSNEVPDSLIALIENGWRELMRLCYLREGEESRAWEISNIVLDQLLVRANPNNVNLDDVLFKPEELLRLIKKGLDKVPSSNVKQEEILFRLQSWIQAGDFSQVDWITYVSPKFINQSAIDGQSESLALDKWLRRAHNLAVNRWVDFEDGGGEKKRCQLVWKSKDKDINVFVDRLGRKAHELSASQLATQLKSGACKAVSATEFSPIDSGMFGMLENAHDGFLERSSIDPLTQVYQRDAFERLLANTISTAKKNATKYVICYLDIQGFKALNTAMGFAGGDELLKTFAYRLKENSESDTVIGRLGGNSFAMVFPTPDVDASYRRVSTLKDNLERKKYHIGSDSFQLSTTVSMVTYDETFSRVTELLHLVDAAVQIAKKTGKKDVQVVDINDPALRNYEKTLASINVINKAIDGDNLSLRCQEICPINTSSSEALIYEVLVTVIDEDGVPLPTNEFVQAAEEYGQMSQVDRRVIKYLLSWMSSQMDLLQNINGLCINLSGQSINDETFLDFLFTEFVNTNVPRDKLIFEITELTAVANFDDAADLITELKNIGCRFSIDNFGLAHSAYTSLRMLPVDMVKIEGSLVTNVAESEIDFGLIKSIVELGHFLNKQVVAKHVSDAKIKRALQEIGVDYVQGYFIGRPILLEALPQHALDRFM